MILGYILCFIGTIPTQAATYPSITAPYGVVIEASTGKVLYHKDASTAFIPASLVKVMTAYIIFEEIAAGNLTLDTEIQISPENAYLSGYFPAKVLLAEGSYVDVDTLLKLILIPSARAACLVMAEHISGSHDAFLVRMNETATRLGMNSLYLDCYGAGESRVTALDQARLIQVFLEQFPEIFDYTTLTSVTHNGRTYNATNQFLNTSSQFYDESVDGTKTGTPAAGSNICITAERDGKRIIAVVGLSTSNNNRYSDMTAMIEYGFHQLNQEDYLYFRDTAPYESASIYDAFREKGVYLQSEFGWVRPLDYITLGEFSTTFITALEQYGILEAVTPDPLPSAWDITRHIDRGILYRGISYNILPTAPDGSFSPDVPLIQGDINSIFNRAHEALGLPSPQLPETTTRTNSHVSRIYAIRQINQYLSYLGINI